MKREVTINEVENMAASARETIWSKAKAEGREPKIYLHWTAGNHTTVFEDYHINITGDGSIYVTTDDLSETKSHTWRRNTGSIGIALCCCYGGGSASLGGFPPTAKQIESEALKPILLEVLRSGVIAKCSDIIRSDERLANYTTQKISPILKKMEAEGTVVKIVKGKDVLYSANDQ